jgi:adenylate cyclase
LKLLNAGRAASGKAPIQIGIGINTDEVVSGNIGSMKRMDYTAIGDGVNLAARLESSSKTYGAQLIISEFTKRALRGAYKLREIDRVIVKGKTEPVAIFEVLDHHDPESFPRIDDVLTLFQDGVGSYRRREWRAGLHSFEEALRMNPGEPLSKLYAARCRHFLASPPEENWNGVWVMTAK